MNKFKFYFFVFCSTIILFSCNKSDSADEIVIRDFDVQYQDDMAMIEEYLTTHYITDMDASPTQDVEIRKITPTENFPSMMSLFVEAGVVSEMYPQLRKKAFEFNDKTYAVYYIKLRADNTDPTTLTPSRVDGVLSAYKGSYLNYNTDEDTQVRTLNATLFEYTPFPVDFLTLDLAIRGWTEVFPLFKAGNKVSVDGQPTIYTDFGAGVVFIPSSFAYFNRGQFVQSTGITIPSYSPLVFTFKLLEVERADQDLDGVLSNDEDLNQDGDFTNDDTDGDTVQNLYDVDDDGDGYLTKYEIHKDALGVIIFEDADNDGIANYLDADSYPLN